MYTDPAPLIPDMYPLYVDSNWGGGCSQGCRKALTLPVTMREAAKIMAARWLCERAKLIELRYLENWQIGTKAF